MTMHFRVRCHLLFVIVGSIIHRRPCANALSLAATCNDTEWQDTADAAFDFYAQQAAQHWSAATASRSDKTAQAVTEGEFALNLRGTKQQCLVEFVYHAARRTMQLGRRFKVYAVGALSDSAQLLAGAS